MASTLGVTVRVPGDAARAVATGMMQSRGKLRPSDYSARLGTARIPRASNSYPSEMAIRCHTLPVSVPVLKKPAFDLMTDTRIILVYHRKQAKRVHLYSCLRENSERYSGLNPRRRGIAFVSVRVPAQGNYFHLLSGVEASDSAS